MGMRERRLREEIRVAFVGVPFPFADAWPECQKAVTALQRRYGDPLYPYAGLDSERVDDDEARTAIGLLLSDAFNLEAGDISYLIPRVMVYVIGDYPPGAILANDLISLLNVPSQLSQALLDAPELASWRPDYEGAIPGLSAAKLELLSGLTRPQWHAILGWLAYVREWPEMEFRRAEVDSAIGYWSAPSAPRVP